MRGSRRRSGWCGLWGWCGGWYGADWVMRTLGLVRGLGGADSGAGTGQTERWDDGAVGGLGENGANGNYDPLFSR
ncbi:hypothetical protein [Paenibacillus planticolens]|uniref:Uncharacterized protein n=1 Tax=Paenibacillus planticolens TaxID=2654976 RepID=A0ABX1ZSC9_9BACL|nr:hypothetical protein [Paenibacillus planticolens]NOV02548.1 hypothetical protein [Paenibacillus planticolens]